MTMKCIRWAGLAAAAVLAAALTGCGTPKVSVVHAQKQMAPFVYEAPAHLEALHTLSVVPLVSGPIISDLPDIGTAVQAGQLLLQIDPAPYEAQRDEMAARIAAGTAQASAPAPAADDSMEASLLRQGIITRAEYERLRARRGRAPAPAAAPQTDEASMIALQTAQKAVNDCTILAPISGIISQNYVADTKTAAAGQPALVIRQDSPVLASLQIPSEMDPILEQAKAGKTLNVTISDGSRTWYGELKPQPNPNGDAYTVYRVQADNPDGAMEIGKEYDVRIDSGRQVEGYVIPASAFIKDDMVEIVNKDDLIDVRTVTVASNLGEDRLVIGGLADGDRVVARPSEDLQLGMKVEVR